MTTEPDKAKAIAGISVSLGRVSGIASLIAAVFSFFSYNWVGTRICLGAAGLAFGLVANAVLRD